MTPKVRVGLVWLNYELTQPLDRIREGGWKGGPGLVVDTRTTNVYVSEK
jgi:hypothetical protein